MRIVFMGSSQASATCLHAILRLPGLQVVGLVTQPDRPAGRGRDLTPCPCRRYATERGIVDCITPENVNAPEAVAWIRERRPDVIAVVAFGQFLKEEILTLPRHGCVNCHFSLLPKYRGAAPVTAALLAGDELTGVSIIRMGMGMDDGPILRKAVEPIYSDDTGDSLMDRLAIAGGVTLAKTLKLLDAGTLPVPIEQEDAKATFAHKIKKTDGLIDWRRHGARGGDGPRVSQDRSDQSCLARRAAGNGGLRHGARPCGAHRRRRAAVDGPQGRWRARARWRRVSAGASAHAED